MILGLLALREAPLPTPALLYRTPNSISAPEWRNGEWYWLETSKKPMSQLVRTKASTTQVLFSGTVITGYAVGEKKLASVQKDGKNWEVKIENLDASDEHVIWSGEREPHGIWLSDGKVFWMLNSPPKAKDALPFPTLEGALQLVSMPEETKANSGAKPDLIATLPERMGEQFIGVAQGEAVVSCFREGGIGVTAIYRIDLKTGKYNRIAGEIGRRRALTAKRGDLYWVGSSLEAATSYSIASIHRIKQSSDNAASKTETLTDMLPAGGSLFETANGIIYIDGNQQPQLWRLGAKGDADQAVKEPEGYFYVAAEGQDALLQSTLPVNGSNSLHRMRLP